jgi:hypothetical protein
VKFTWTVRQLNVIPTKEQRTDVVHSVAWEVTGVDGEDSSTASGALSVNTDNVGNFVAYENLTEEQVLSWVFATLGQDGKTKAESQVQTVIEAKRSAITIVQKASLPWSNQQGA